MSSRPTWMSYRNKILPPQKQISKQINSQLDLQREAISHIDELQAGQCCGHLWPLLCSLLLISKHRSIGTLADLCDLVMAFCFLAPALEVDPQLGWRAEKFKHTTASPNPLSSSCQQKEKYRKPITQTGSYNFVLMSASLARKPLPHVALRFPSINPMCLPCFLLLTEMLSDWWTGVSRKLLVIVEKSEHCVSSQRKECLKLESQQ